MRILVAEDDAVSRMVLSKTLEVLGHECVIAHDGEEAWRSWLADPNIDVVVSDWMMPDMDGVELCRRVRDAESSPGHYTYFIFLTTLSEDDQVVAGLDAGADDYLLKPLDRNELHARLKVAQRVTDKHARLARQRDELKRLNANLTELAREDALTGLGNRLRLSEDLEMLLNRVGRYGHRYSIVICDIDHFKEYNDRYGHLAGDEVLRSVAGVLRDNLRTGDSCYRYGGEEFLIILSEQGLEDGLLVAERLRESVESLGIANGASANGSGAGVLTASFGLAEFPPRDHEGTEGTIRRADRALYRAKAGGRNRVEVYTGDEA